MNRNRMILAVSVIAAATAMITGCGSGHGSPAATADVAQAQAKAENCLAEHGNMLTSAGRRAFFTCVSPGSAGQVQRCGTKVLAATGVVTRRQRRNFVQKFAQQCVVAK